MTQLNNSMCSRLVPAAAAPAPTTAITVTGSTFCGRSLSSHVKLNVKARMKRGEMLPSGLVSSRCKLKKAPKREREKRKYRERRRDEEEESPFKSRMGMAIG